MTPSRLGSNDSVTIALELLHAGGVR